MNSLRRNILYWLSKILENPIDYKLTNSQESIIRRIEEYLRMRSEEVRGGILVIGDHGSGKTFLAFVK